MSHSKILAVEAILRHNGRTDYNVRTRTGDTVENHRVTLSDAGAWTYQGKQAPQEFIEAIRAFRHQQYETYRAYYESKRASFEAANVELETEVVW